MIIKPQVAAELKKVISLCKTLGIEGLAFVEGKVMGLNDKRNLCIISQLDLQADAKLGVGRVSELDKRFALFSEATIDCRQNDKGEVTVMTMQAGRSKAQFRCTSLSVLKYPKSNEDPESFILTFTKDDVTNLVKALRTFGAETLVIRAGKDGAAVIEFSDKTNDVFSMVLESKVEFVGEESTTLFTYSADRFASILEIASREQETVTAVIGESGSLTTLLRAHTIILLPSVDSE